MILIENAYSYAGTENICNFMSEALKENNKVTVCSLEGEGEPFYPFDGVELVSFSKRKNKWRDVFLFIKERKIGSVFVVSMGKLSLIFYMHSLLRLNKKHRENINVISCEHVSISSFSPLKKAAKIFALKKYNLVVCLTQKDSDFLSASGVNCKVIKNPADHHALIRNERTNNILCVGRVSYQKGYDILLPIWKKFIDENKNYKLRIAGSGELLESTKLQAEKLGLSENVEFLGKVNNIDHYYKDSDFLIMTSRYEGLPLALLEAKAWSLPVVAFDCPTGPKEIITNGVDGFVVPMGDSDAFLNAMNQLSSDDSILFSMSANTFRTSLTYSSINIKSEWNKIVNRPGE